jgi:hypothetical protein
MGRDRMRVLLCAAAAIALILAGTLAMDWFRMTFVADNPLADLGKISIDLRSMHICHAGHGCASTSISPLPGMFPMLATVTMWSSLGLAALVGFQAGARVLTGAANDAFTKPGYVLAMMAIAVSVATAYMFGPDAEVPVADLAERIGLVLPRTWAPFTLISGLVAGFAALYVAVSRDSSDLGASYKPMLIGPAPAARTRTASIPLPVAAKLPAPTVSGAIPAAVASSPLTDPTPAIGHAKSGPLPRPPAHLRNCLHYVALTAELTAGGIDARREDGSSRLVLWRDVVGVVARRMPPAYDSTTFIDIVSTAGSTLRIVPWTRLTGEPIAAQADARPRGVVERVVAMCPRAKIDPATRQFLEAGPAAQLADLEMLRAHDERLG